MDAEYRGSNFGHTLSTWPVPASVHAIGRVLSTSHGQEPSEIPYEYLYTTRASASLDRSSLERL